jgi:5'-nucleotidase
MASRSSSRRLLLVAASALLLAAALLLLAAAPASAFSVRANAREEAPPASTFAQYVAKRATFTAAQKASSGTAPFTHVTFVHFNDLYELISSGPRGGVARFATLLRRTEALGLPGNTVSVLAGDLFSPSALSTVPVPGSQSGFQVHVHLYLHLDWLDARTSSQLTILSVPFLFLSIGPQGKQMVAVMNVMGLTISTIGNHETDVKQADFAARFQESKFKWLCANARNYSYANIQKEAEVMSFGEANSTTNPRVTVGVWGITLDSNNKAYESYDNFTYSLGVASSTVQGLTTGPSPVDAVVALTHLPYYHDETLVASVPDIDIVMGGHEHIAMEFPPSPATPSNPKKVPGIYKADSNVQSAWIHDLFITPSLPRGDPKRLVIYSHLVEVSRAELVEDPVVGAEVAHWVNVSFKGFEAEGFSPASVLATPTVDLVGTNEVIFAQDTVLTELFNLAELEECAKYNNENEDGFVVPPVEATLFNSGAIRIDDTIPAGTPMLQYDAIRISPYSNAVALVNMTGATLKAALDASMSVQNNSQFLHFYPNITVSPSGVSNATIHNKYVYTINGAALDARASRWYVVGVLGFLLGGGRPYGMLKWPNPTRLVVIKWNRDGDVRRSLLHQIALRFPGSSPSDGGDDHGHRVLGLKAWQAALIFSAVGIVVLLVAFCWVRSRRQQRRSSGSGGGGRYDDREGDIEWSPSTSNAERRQHALNYNRM